MNKHLYKYGGERKVEPSFERRYGSKKGKYIYGAVVGKVKREREGLSANPAAMFDLFKAAGNVLSDVNYDTSILNFTTGCWKVNCSDTKGLYIPFTVKTRHFDLPGVSIDAVEEINLVPYLAGALLLYFIFK